MIANGERPLFLEGLREELLALFEAQVAGLTLDLAGRLQLCGGVMLKDAALRTQVIDEGTQGRDLARTIRVTGLEFAS